MSSPALEHLVDAYFHQDWFAEHQDEWANVQDFIDREPAFAPLLPGEIGQVLADLTSDDQVKAYLDELGSCYTTSDGQGGYREWLREVARRVEAGLAEQS